MLIFHASNRENSGSSTVKMLILCGLFDSTRKLLRSADFELMAIDLCRGDGMKLNRRRQSMAPHFHQISSLIVSTLPLASSMWKLFSNITCPLLFFSVTTALIRQNQRCRLGSIHPGACMQTISTSAEVSCLRD